MATDMSDMSDSKHPPQDVNAEIMVDPMLGGDEKKLLRKLDKHIIPLVMLLC